MQDFFKKIIFALIAGFSEFMPVSAPAHYELYQYLTGFRIEPLMMLAVHIGCLAACVACCGKRLKRLRNERKAAARLRKRSGRKAGSAMLMDGALLKIAIVPVALGYLFYRKATGWIDTMGLLALMLLINGIVLFASRFFAQGNKDGRSLSRMDGLLMGMGGMFGILPGYSRFGGIYSIATIRGTDRNYAMETALTLSLPAFSVMICFDIYEVITYGSAVSAGALLLLLLVVAVAFGCGYLAIGLMRYFAGKTDLTGFSYYSWGLAFYAFLLYLIIH